MSSSPTESYRRARQQISSIFSKTENEALKEVEELNVLLQKTQEDIYSQEQKMKQLCFSLEIEVSENQTLWDQVEYLTNELQRERTWREQFAKLFIREREKCIEEQIMRRELGLQLEETKKCLADQRSQEKLFTSNVMEEEWKTELDRLKVSYHKIQQQVEQKLNQLQQEAIERETSFNRFYSELEDLKIQIHELISTSLKEEVSQIMHTEAPQVTEGLNGERPTPELQEEAEDSKEKDPEKKRKTSFWKRTCHSLNLSRKSREKPEN